MAFGTRTTVFNNMDADNVGTLEYTPGGGNTIDVNVADGFELQGTGCIETRFDNENNFIQAVGASNNASRNLSSSGSATLYWLNTSVGSTLTSYDVLIHDGSNNGIVNLGSFYPATGGYTPIWCDVPSLSGSITTSNVEAIGFRVSNNDAGSGNKPNTFLDNFITFVGSQVSPFYINGTTDNTIAFIRATESNKTNGYKGLLVTQAGADLFYCRLTIGEGATAGTAIATTFSESDKTFIHVDQAAIDTAWLGWTVNLGNASTTFSMTNCNFQSSAVSIATNRPDLIFTGTTGTATISSCALLGLRLITMNSSVEITGGTVDAIALTLGGGSIENADIRPRSASAVAMITDAAFGTTTGINNCNIINVGSGHAFEFTATTYTADTSITFTNIVFDNTTFGANGSTSAAIRNTSGFEITVALNGTSNTPTVTNVGAGSSVVFVAAKALVIDNIEDETELRVYSYTDLNNPLTYTELVGAERVGATPDSSTFDSIAADPVNAGKYKVTSSYDTSGGDINVVIVAHNLNFEFFRVQKVLTASADTTISLFQSSDRQYDSGTV